MKTQTHIIHEDKWHTTVSFTIHKAKNGDTVVVPTQFVNQTVNCVAVQGKRMTVISIDNFLKEQEPKKPKKKAAKKKK